MISQQWSAYAQTILNKMTDIVRLGGLELLQRYPDDLLVHDLSYLRRYARPGAVLAWVVGDCHTHLTTLGFTKGDTELVSALTNLASKDRFFRIRCNAGGAVFEQLTREAFGALASTPVPFQVGNIIDGIQLWRHETLVGSALIRRLAVEPQCTNASYEAIITPSACVSETDLAALEAATCQRIHQLGSLFAFYNITVVKPTATTVSTKEAAYA